MAMDKKNLVLFVAMVLAAFAGRSQSAIGEWQDHNSFVSGRHVYATADRVYVATRMAMFYYDKNEYSVTGMTKVKGLSDVGISTFAYDEATKCLVVAYTNSGIDFKRDGQVHYVADIRRSGISGDKQVYHIRFNDGRAYLACGFGIVVIDMSTYEVSDTYYLGEDGGHAVVYDVAFTDSLIVAGTDDGFLAAPKNSRRLHICDTWTRDTVTPMRGMSVRTLEVSPKRGRCRLLALACADNPDSLTTFFQSDDGRWDRWEAGRITSLRCHNGRIVLSRFSSVEVYDDNYQLVDTVGLLPVYGMAAWDADSDGDSTIWIGHTWAGLLRVPYKSGQVRGYCPEGPSCNDYVYSLTAVPNALYLCPGGKLPTYENTYLDGNINILSEDGWEQLSRGSVSSTIQDVINVAVDPTDESHVSATAWGYGVLDVKDNTLQTLYEKANTNGALTPYTSGNFTSLRVGGLVYDGEGNLWVTNSLVDNGLAVRYHNGDWESFNTSAIVKGAEIDKIIWDSVNNYKWFAGRANRVYVHDGKSKMAYVNPNNGSKMETHAVNCLVQDHSGDIWIGTDKGIKVIYDAYKALANGGNGEQAPVTCSNILYNEDGINEYLMAYENISCIVVDGANRKWVGTSNNGLYLISANGTEQLQHFTMDNSLLASDKVLTLAVHPESGILYIGTDKGLQSYRSTATEAGLEPQDNIHAFPNPVRPGYDGPIAIKGFTRDALVHITDAAGHVVFTAQAYGGQVIWDGRTLNGERVSSGPYFVFASDRNGNMRSVAKVLIIK